MFHLRSMLATPKRILFCIILTLASFGAHADWVYGPPYSYNTPYGSEGGILSVDAAINSLLSHYECRLHEFTDVQAPHIFCGV